MASEYLRRKYQDVKPDEPPPPLTGKAKAENWFHYHKWWLAAGAVLLAIVGSMVWNILGIGQVRPDYRVAYIGDNEMPEDQAAALSEALATLGEDVNGDGKVKVELRQYAMDRGGDAETAMYYGYAADVVLMADLTEAESYFFLVEDPAGVQLSYQIFANDDGTPPADSDYEAMDKVYRWSDCPVLAGLDADQEALSGLYIVRRCFYDEKQAQAQGANDALWAVITKGAVR